HPPARADGSVVSRALASLGDCPDPLARELLVQVISHGTDHPGTRLSGILQHPQDGPVLYEIVPCPVGDEQLWWLGSYAPREALLGPVKELRTRGLVIALASVLIAGALASAFARHVVRTEQAHAAARRAVKVAESRADELGAYRLLKKLGEGGMGEVWRAEHRQLARPAAIKLIRAQLGGADASSEHIQRFEREAQAIACLRSSHTIDLYDFGVAADGGLFYVMELLDGLDLDDLVARFGPQPAGRVIRILVQICSSLGEAHTRGLIHRDIKPANVYLCRQADEVDVVKVLDFGLVLANEKISGQERLTNSGLVHGTPSYMAPEQAQGDALDGRADLYALGCVAYWLLTGETVFADKGTMQQIISHVERPPRPLAEVVKHPLPPGLAEIIMGCLAKDPAQRPRDAKTLADALRGVVCSDADAWTDAEAQRWWAANVPLADFSRPINPDAASMRRR
ncbi:MAG: serine/threonine protein kinase, partial [Planctomycetes bacterium]|nr:serine/threonine protein kinase [Planctomycetota bacterium]